MAQLDSGLNKDPQFVVALQEGKNASFTKSISGCLGPTWALQEQEPLLYSDMFGMMHSSLVVQMKEGSP